MLSSATQWHHISGSANPADLATRGVSSSTLLTSIWLCGPKFLHETFPIQTDSSVSSLNDALPEERPLTSIPKPNYIDSNNSYLTRWQQIQKLVQQFWKRWHKEYLTRLQQRPKWLLPTKNFQVNDLFLIKDDNLPPTRWKMGRIVQLRPGLDNKVRVVNVKTSYGIFKRNITKLSLLPI
ncbi:integrase catalytic domain-containing protein [Trichonephila clavipes]|nr:integrase catalytic domain-containing protein [Trichonephila clavipes]